MLGAIRCTTDMGTTYYPLPGAHTATAFPAICQATGRLFYYFGLRDFTSKPKREDPAHFCAGSWCFEPKFILAVLRLHAEMAWIELLLGAS